MAVYTCIRLIKCQHILRIVPLSKIIYMRLSANARPASQTVSQHWLILFPEFYKQTIKENNKKMKSRVVGRGAMGSRGFSTYPFGLRRRSSGKPALQIGPTSHKFAGHIWLEIHLISDRHSLYRPNMGDWLMLTIKIIHILWRQVGSWLTQGVSGSSPTTAEIFPWYTHMQRPKLFKFVG